MAKIYYGAGSDDTLRGAEKVLLERFKTLPDDYTIIHSAKWIAHLQATDHGSVGEADFIIAHRNHGVLIGEAKGGVISIERAGGKSAWFSTDANSTRWSIKDPCAQADRSRYALKEWLKRDPRTKGMQYAIFPFVMLPDSHVSVDIRPDCTQDILLDMIRCDSLSRSVNEVFTYWKGRQPRESMGGQEAVDALVELLVPTRTLQPRIAEIFARERKQIDKLTRDQFDTLKKLRMHRRAVIVGGAGTGKTMLAMEKAQQLADADFRVLMLCFNNNLASWLSRNLKGKNIDVMTFHGLAGKAVKWANLPTDPRMKDKQFHEHAADLLADSLALLHKMGDAGKDKLYDAVIIDEAQDFPDEWWIPLSDVLKAPDQGVFYIFMDDNQRLYTQIANLPFQADPLCLTTNCRNTQGIFTALKLYARPGDDTACIGPSGRSVHVNAVSDPKDAHEKLKLIIEDLVKEGIDWHDIVVLTPRAQEKSIWKDDEMLGEYVLTWNLDSEMDKAIRVSTIYAYKGLESSVVILSELDKGYEGVLDPLIYVGLSRARNHVIVLGELPKPQPGRVLQMTVAQSKDSAPSAPVDPSPVQPESAPTIHDAVYQRLIEIASARKLITYGELAPLAGLNMGSPADRTKMGVLLGDIVVHEHAAGRPPLAAVAVLKNGLLPSGGFYSIARDLGLFDGDGSEAEHAFFQESLEAVYRTWAKVAADQAPVVTKRLTPDEIRPIIMSTPIPPGQINLYKLLYEADEGGLTLQELADRMREGNLVKMGGVFGGLSLRISLRIKGDGRRPYEYFLLVSKGENGTERYYLRPETRIAIESIPELHQIITHRSIEDIYTRYAKYLVIER